jgi:RNA polymerase sigma-32 factor
VIRNIFRATAMNILVDKNNKFPPAKADDVDVRAYSENTQIAEYIKEINKFPILTEEQERFFLKDFFENQNLKAGHIVLNSHLRLVVKIAMEYKRFHASLLDLIAEGNVGLLKALKKFSLEKEVRFATYAIIWIKASIKNFLTKSISSVKAITTNSQKKLLFNLTKAKKYLGIEGSNLNSNQVSQISQMLAVSPDEIKSYENMMFEIKETSLNDKIYSNDEVTERGDLTSNSEDNLETKISTKSEYEALKKTLKMAMEGLTEREREIVKYRILEPEKYTLHDLSNKFSISRERVRQLQDNALKKLKKILQNENLTFSVF